MLFLPEPKKIRQPKMRLIGPTYSLCRRSVPNEYFDKLLAEGLMQPTDKTDIGQGGEEVKNYR